MKSDYITRAQKFINQFINFAGPTDLEDWNDISAVEDTVYAFNCEYHRKVKFANGVARMALITSDYVVKWDYNKENANYYGGCENEVENYELAKRDGYEHLFAEITPFTVGTRTFYIMPRINSIGEVAQRYKEIGEFLTFEEYMYLEDVAWDLHDENWGIRQGHAVIVDYASFY